MNDTLSKVKLIFNDKFKFFINKLKIEIDISALYGDVTIEGTMVIQAKIRDYMLKNQDDFDKVGKIHLYSFPEFFVVMLCIIFPDISTLNNLNELFDEDKIEKSNYAELWSSDTDQVIGDNECKCACNQQCCAKNLYKIRNKTTLLTLIVGCDCIKKGNFIEPYILKQLKSRSNESPHYKKYEMIQQKRKDEKKREKINQELKKITDFEISFEIIAQNYNYVGRSYENKQCTICDVNHDIIYDLNYLNNDDDITIPLCENCCNDFGKLPKKAGKICDKCKNPHKNRSDNLCNYCRQLKECCFCTNEVIRLDINNRCDVCCKYCYCSGCNIVRVDNKGWKCKTCKKCECGKIILDNKFNKCYICNNYEKNLSEARRLEERRLEERRLEERRLEERRLEERRLEERRLLERRLEERRLDVINECKKCNCGRIISNEKNNKCYFCNNCEKGSSEARILDAIRLDAMNEYKKRNNM